MGWKEVDSHHFTHKYIYTNVYVYVFFHIFHMSIASMWSIYVPFFPSSRNFKYAPTRTYPPNFQLNRNAPFKILNVLFICIRNPGLVWVCVCVCEIIWYMNYCAQASVYVIIIIIGIWRELLTLAPSLFIPFITNWKCTKAWHISR